VRRIAGRRAFWNPEIDLKGSFGILPYFARPILYLLSVHQKRAASAEAARADHRDRRCWRTSASHRREQNRNPQTEAIAEDRDAFERL
jgi:hypothetical protein